LLRRSCHFADAVTMSEIEDPPVPRSGTGTRMTVTISVAIVLTLIVTATAFGSAGRFVNTRAVSLDLANSAAANCRQGRLPDRRCTQGATFNVGAAQVCVPGYSSQVRHVPESEKRQAYAEYGIRSHARGQYEVDHLVPLELGGSNSIRNLWPEAANPRPGFHEKDRLENKLHRLVCGGSLSLHKAQSLMETNWVAAFNTYV
jgi:hypothetical protein